MSARRLDAQLQEAALARHGASRQALEAQIQRTLQADRSVAEKTFHAVMKELDAILPLAPKPILEAAAVRKQCTPKQIQEMAKKVAAAPPIIADGAAADVRAFASEKRASVDVATRLWRETAETAARPLEESDAGVEAAWAATPLGRSNNTVYASKLLAAHRALETHDKVLLLDDTTYIKPGAADVFEACAGSVVCGYSEGTATDVSPSQATWEASSPSALSPRLSFRTFSASSCFTTIWSVAPSAAFREVSCASPTWGTS